MPRRAGRARGPAGSLNPRTRPVGSVKLDSRTRRVGGVTFVAATLVNDESEPMRARVAARAEPVWPPRRHGVPCAGWDDGGYEAVLGAGETLALGFATSATIDGEPVGVAWTEPAPETERPPADPVRELGDPRPPRDAVPAPCVLPPEVLDWLDETTGRVERGAGEPSDREALRRTSARARAALRANGQNERGERA